MCWFQWKAEERLYNLHGVFFQTHKLLKNKTIAEKQSKEEALTLNLSHGSFKKQREDNHLHQIAVCPKWWGGILPEPAV